MADTQSCVTICTENDCKADILVLILNICKSVILVAGKPVVNPLMPNSDL